VSIPRIEVGERCFDDFYFANCCGRPYARDEHWLTFFGAIAERIVADFRPRRVLDAGCAYGLLVECLRARGVEAFGIDLSSFAISQAHESVRAFCRQGSLTGDLGGSYDLVVCIEVLEHMAAGDAEQAIAGFCASAPEVLFSSSPLDVREPTHVNVQPPEHWAEVFARRGFFHDVDYDASFLTPWAMRLRRADEPVHRLVRRLERRYWQLASQAHGARAYALEVQDRLAATERERDRLRVDSEQLGRARNIIACMQASRFWKLRNAWMRVKRALGRGDDPVGSI
jgi:SAM-dependent methyltransferase